MQPGMAPKLLRRRPPSGLPEQQLRHYLPRLGGDVAPCSLWEGESGETSHLSAMNGDNECRENVSIGRGRQGRVRQGCGGGGRGECDSALPPTAQHIYHHLPWKRGPAPYSSAQYIYHHLLEARSRSLLQLLLLTGERQPTTQQLIGSHAQSPHAGKGGRRGRGRGKCGECGECG